MSNKINLNFDLYPKQMLALTTSAQMVVYGGAAGGGKSHLARIAAIAAALQIPGLQVYLFRRHYNDLVLNHMNGPTGFRELLFDLTQQGLVKIVDDQIRFYNGRNKTLGSTIHLCHCQYDSDVEKYRGAEIHFFIPEETTQFSENQLRFLLSRVRVPDSLPIPKEERAKYPRILMPTNPGGLSHKYIKTNFIDNREELKVWTQDENEGGRQCIFIPAKLSDNPSINPTEYRMALMGLKRPELIDAMLNGSWDIPLGAFFPEADERVHLLKHLEIPNHWYKFRTFDWGSGAPFCVQWWAVSDGTKFGITSQKEMLHIPRGALVCYREWYGCSPSDTKIGLGLSNSQVAEGIKDRTPNNELIQATVTDSKPFQATGMTSKIDLGSTPAKEFASLGVPLQKGVVNPGSRVLGWQQLRSRLIDKMIFFLDKCPHTWRTLTEIQVDPKDVEDCDSSAEDHPVDAVGLAVKAQPLIKDLPKDNKPKFLNESKFDDVLNMHLKLKRMNDNNSR